jgi:hypothetical protein
MLCFIAPYADSFLHTTCWWSPRYNTVSDTVLVPFVFFNLFSFVLLSFYFFIFGLKNAAYTTSIASYLSLHYAVFIVSGS